MRMTKDIAAGESDDCYRLVLLENRKRDPFHAQFGKDARHRAYGQMLCVALLGKMRQCKALELLRGEPTHQLRRLIVGEMSPGPRDALYYRNRTPTAEKQLWVVIRL